MDSQRTIPVIDLFAGPGGLGEGFSAFDPHAVGWAVPTIFSPSPPHAAATPNPALTRHTPPAAGGTDIPVCAPHGGFRIALSVEKDPHARETLRLRSFFRQFPSGSAPEPYYALLRGEFPLAEFPDRLRAANADWFEAWRRADAEARQFELGAPGHDPRELFQRIDAAVRDAAGRWVLIGGPPCQAYSVVGRSRNKGKAGYRIEDDHRSSLYREYLRIIADHWPAVFVMENVKGMLSAKLDGKLHRHHTRFG